MANPSFETAIEKARAKREIAERLAALPRDAQRDVLADLLLALDADPVQVTTGQPTKARVSLPSGGAGGRKGKKWKVRVGRPSKAQRAEGSGKTDAILALLRTTPRMPIADMAQSAYGGADDATRGKVRAILWSLKKQGRVKNVGTGEWEATTEKP